MATSSFAVQFKFASLPENGKLIRMRHHTYQANITTLSKAFNLFEVSGIKRITKRRTIQLPGSYYLTSYPISFAGKETWTDAVTMNADEFLQAIGVAIDSYLNAPAASGYTCLN